MFDRLAVDEAVDNLRDVRDRNAPVKKMIGFDQNRHAGCALIETARCADTRLEFCESACGNLLFQRSIHFFRVLGRAASFRIVVGPTIDADKEIALPLQRGESRVGRIGRQRPRSLIYVASRPSSKQGSRLRDRLAQCLYRFCSDWFI